MNYTINEGQGSGKNEYTGERVVFVEATKNQYNTKNPIPEPVTQPPKVLGVKHLIISCFCSGLIGGLIFLGGFSILNNSGSDDGENLLNMASPTESIAQATPTKEPSNVEYTINVTDVQSPATAVAKKVLPSIVGIRVTTTVSSYYGTYNTTGEGSGIIYTDDGYIITNYHVIADTVTSSGEANSSALLQVFLYEDQNTAIEAKVIGYNVSADLAVIKIDRTGLTEIEIGNSDDVNVGDIAIALGNPGGLEYMGSVSQGIISGLNRTIQSEDTFQDMTLIQTDAAINPGNSGGALVNIYGQLIGVNSVKLVETSYEGLGFAIPSVDVVNICNAIIQNGSSTNAYIGIEFSSTYTAEYLERLGYPGGLFVSSVAKESPAEVSGIREEDIITAFNGTEVTTAEEFIKLRSQCKPGDSVTVTIYRLKNIGFGRWQGDYQDITVVLG